MTDVNSNNDQVRSQDEAQKDNFLAGLEDLLTEAKDENEDEVLALRAAAW